MYAFAKVLFAIIVAFLLMMVASECYHNEEFVPLEEVGKMIDLNEMARDALKTATEREKKGQLLSDTMSVLKHCAGEVVEATDAFEKWKNFTDYKTEQERRIDYENELADIICCALIAAARDWVDIEAALLRVKEKNARRAE